MDQTLQDKFKAELKEQYQKKAFECFLNYDFQGIRYGKIVKEFDEKEASCKALEDEISKIQALPDYHTVENKNKVKILRDTIKSNQQQVQSMKPVLDKMHKELVDWQQKGMQLLDTSEHCDVFKISTPEEIKVKQAETKTEGPLPDAPKPDSETGVGEQQILTPAESAAA